MFKHSFFFKPVYVRHLDHHPTFARENPDSVNATIILAEGHANDASTDSSTSLLAPVSLRIFFLGALFLIEFHFEAEFAGRDLYLKN